MKSARQIRIRVSCVVAALLGAAESCSPRPPNEVVALPSALTTEAGSFRYDAAGGQYIFNLSTKKMSAGTWLLRADLGDLVDHVVQISLR